MSDEELLENLVHRHLEGALTPDEARRLSELVAGDPGRARVLAERAYDEKQLRRHFRVAAALAPVASGRPRAKPIPRRSVRRGQKLATGLPLGVAAAVAGALLALGVFLWNFGSRAPAPSEARRAEEAPAATEQKAHEEELSRLKEERRRFEDAQRRANEARKEEDRRQAEEELRRVAAEHKAAVERFEKSRAKDAVPPELPKPPPALSPAGIAGRVTWAAQAVPPRSVVVRGTGGDEFRAPLAKAMILRVGDRMETTSETGVSRKVQAALEVFDGAIVELSDGTTVVLVDSSGDEKVVEVSRGLAYVASNTLSQSGKRLRLRTPHGDAVTRGTRFDLYVDPNETRVRMEEGEVTLSNALGSVVVTALHEGVLPSGRAPAPPRAIDFKSAFAWRIGAAPGDEQPEGRALLVFDFEEPGAEDVSWERWSNAITYRGSRGAAEGKVRRSGLADVPEVARDFFKRPITVTPRTRFVARVYTDQGSLQLLLHNSTLSQNYRYAVPVERKLAWQKISVPVVGFLSNPADARTSLRPGDEVASFVVGGGTGVQEGGGRLLVVDDFALVEPVD